MFYCIFLEELERMPDFQQLKKKYLDDAETMGSKSRFGYFSILPSATAGENAFEQKKVIKDENGKVKTEDRNIFPGVCTTGVLKKNFFNYSSSVFVGDPYLDPHKIEKKKKNPDDKNIEGKDVFKFSVSVKEPYASFQYIPQKPQKKLVKDIVDENGKVRTEERNIFASPDSKIEADKIKKMKYIPDLYGAHLDLERKEKFKEISQRGEVPFKLGNPGKDYFHTARQLYHSVPTTQKKDKKSVAQSNPHEAKFRPSCCKKYDVFSYPEYKPGGKRERPKSKPIATQRPQKFKPVKQPNNYKPSPSITTMKTNVYRCIR